MPRCLWSQEITTGKEEEAVTLKRATQWQEPLGKPACCSIAVLHHHAQVCGGTLRDLQGQHPTDGRARRVDKPRHSGSRLVVRQEVTDKQNRAHGVRTPEVLLPCCTLASWPFPDVGVHSKQREPRQEERTGGGWRLLCCGASLPEPALGSSPDFYAPDVGKQRWVWLVRTKQDSRRCDTSLQQITPAEKQQILERWLASRELALSPNLNAAVAMTAHECRRTEGPQLGTHPLPNLARNDAGSREGGCDVNAEDPKAGDREMEKALDLPNQLEHAEAAHTEQNMQSPRDCTTQAPAGLLLSFICLFC
ncbi:hypothetical protein E5288_WYG012240 [Bos mutus]|uniref:Uncharacterized protein n=1 Tax=Bos mutus TaxID=72004 RepID=A0A6B0RFS3_9CETA|nr:hypothetical protein [Bos mutus]